jgi:hypothetical protein
MGFSTILLGIKPKNPNWKRLHQHIFVTPAFIPSTSPRSYPCCIDIARPIPAKPGISDDLALPVTGAYVKDARSKAVEAHLKYDSFLYAPNMSILEKKGACQRDLIKEVLIKTIYSKVERRNKIVTSYKPCLAKKSYVSWKPAVALLWSGKAWPVLGWITTSMAFAFG